MPRTIDAITKAIRQRLIDQVDGLDGRNVYEGFEPLLAGDIPFSDRAAVVMAPSIPKIPGFRGGLEWKRLRYAINLLHRVSTDMPGDKSEIGRRLLGTYQDDVVTALQNQFLTGDGAVNEPIEWTGMGIPMWIADVSVAMVSMSFECSAVDLTLDVF